MPKTNDVDVEMYVCCQCNQSRPLETSYFKTYSGLYAKTGRLPVCKECLIKLFNKYVIIYGSTRKAMKRICMAYDLYYDEGTFDICDNGTDSTLGNYVKRLNMIQNKDKTFDDTLAKGFVFDKESKTKKLKRSEMPSETEEAEEPPIDPADIEKWGDGLAYEDYLSLNNHYRFLKNANPNCDSNQEIFIIDLCYTKMLQLKAVRDGNPDVFSKMSEQYRKTFEKAGLKTVRDANTDDSFEFGATIEAIEKYTPAEYYKNKTLYKDFDGIGEYFERFILRPLRNLQYGSTDRDSEYYVKSEEDAYGDDE